jgi:ribosomal protein S18 acetylase RimI-like enzyme
MVRRAELVEARSLATTLAAAFQADPVSAWVFPDPDDRTGRHPHFFRIFVDVALTHGAAYTTPDYDAVALWVDVDPDNPTPALHLGDLFEEACGPNYARFQKLDEAMYQHHPRQAAHAYLAFVGVLPERQGRGVGAALLCHRLDELDSMRLPAHLEATSARSRGLYERLGFRRLPTRIDLPHGPSLWPMWRPAAPEGFQATQPPTVDGAP